MQTDRPVTTAGQNRNRKYNLNICWPFVFPEPEVVITEPIFGNTQRCWMSEETGTIKLEARSWYAKVAAAVLKTNVTSSVVKYTAGCQIHKTLDALMQTEIPITTGRSNSKGKVQYGGLSLHTAGNGFVQYYISLKFSRKTANTNVKNNVLWQRVKRPIIDTHKTAKILFVTSSAVDVIRTVYYIHGPWRDIKNFCCSYMCQ